MAKSRRFAAQAEVNGLTVLKQGGMTVQGSIDRASFVAAMAGANPEFDKRFGRGLIDQIRQVKPTT